MKINVCISSFAIALLLQASLQGQTYSVSVYQQEYVSLGIGFPLTEGVWDDPSYVVPLGSEFMLFDQLITILQSAEGFTSGGTLATDLSGGLTSVIDVFGPDIVDRGAPSGSSISAIYFAYSGTPGQRVFTQEWLNVGFFGGDIANGMFTDFINFQLILDEATGDILFHFGPSSITNPAANYAGEAGPGLGLLKNVDLNNPGVAEEVVLLSGSPTNPTIVTEFSEVYLNASIPPNTVYRFSQEASSVSDDKVKKEVAVFYPNPASGDLFIRQGFEDAVTYPVQVYNSCGVLLKSVSTPDQLSVVGLPSGIIHLRWNSDTGLTTQRVVVLPQ
jgi:hypothetical protein